MLQIFVNKEYYTLKRFVYEIFPLIMAALLPNDQFGWRVYLMNIQFPKFFFNLNELTHC